MCFATGRILEQNSAWRIIRVYCCCNMFDHDYSTLVSVWSAVVVYSHDIPEVPRLWTIKKGQLKKEILSQR